MQKDEASGDVVDESLVPEEEPACPNPIWTFAQWRVNYKENPYALKVGRPVNYFHWPDFKVQAPNPTFGCGTYRLRVMVVFWAPPIFWPW